MRPTLLIAILGIAIVFSGAAYAVRYTSLFQEPVVPARPFQLAKEEAAETLEEDTPPEPIL